MATTNSTPVQTAKIYQFPIGGRLLAGPRRKDITPMDLRTQNITPTIAGSGWYHDAAIQDAKRTYEH